MGRRFSQSVASLLLQWQSTGDEQKLEALFASVGSLVEQVSRHVLLAAGITDPGAVDDAMSKVLDHLRRLPGPREGERAVAVFQPTGSDDSEGREGSLSIGDVSCRGDAGIAFIRWLAGKRARDVARATLRRARHTRLFSQLEFENAGLVRSFEARDRLEGERLGDDVLLAIESLDDRSRQLVELLLEGKSQAEMARRMGVCEGTVSRIRARAIATLRAAIEMPADANGVGRSGK